MANYARYRAITYKVWWYFDGFFCTRDKTKFDAKINELEYLGIDYYWEVEKELIY